MSLPSIQRLRRSAEFKTTYQTGTRMTSRYFAAFCLRNEVADGRGAPTRFGFTVPRAVGKSVQRNRIKRRMREAVRSCTVSLPERWTIVFNPRRNVLTASFDQLCREVNRILVRCNES